MIEVKIYKSEMGVEPFKKWIDSIKSTRAKQKVLRSMSKIERGLLSDVKPVGEGVQEYRIHFEKGYRIYFGHDGEQIIVLLVGSTKSDQKKEIEAAKNYWKDYKRQKKEKQHEKIK